jgi:hypothetical protein
MDNEMCCWMKRNKSSCMGEMLSFSNGVKNSPLGVWDARLAIVDVVDWPTLTTRNRALSASHEKREDRWTIVSSVRFQILLLQASLEFRVVTVATRSATVGMTCQALHNIEANQARENRTGGWTQ